MTRFDVPSDYTVLQLDILGKVLEKDAPCNPHEVFTSVDKYYQEIGKKRPNYESIRKNMRESLVEKKCLEIRIENEMESFHITEKGKAIVVNMVALDMQSGDVTFVISSTSPQCCNLESRCEIRGEYYLDKDTSLIHKGLTVIKIKEPREISVRAEKKAILKVNTSFRISDADKPVMRELEKRKELASSR